MLESAVVVWSIPSNGNLAKFLLGYDGVVWELSRLWAPDGHERNLLTRAISLAADWIGRREAPDALVSFADPNAGHRGGVYRAASWIEHGRSEESRAYFKNGQMTARRAFHSGRVGMTLAEIEAAGYQQVNLPGKIRWVRPLSKRARKACLARMAVAAPEGGTDAR